MAHHVIVDGYNVIRQLPALADRERRSLEEGRRALLDRLAGYRRAAGHRITVVFDGVMKGGFEETRTRERGVEVVYTPRGTTADETIVRLARDSSRGAVVVVTADREVARQATRRGAAVVSPAAFESRLEAPPPAAPAAGAADPAEGREDDADEAATRPAKRGNPRKAPKAERRAARRLEKL